MRVELVVFVALFKMLFMVFAVNGACYCVCSPPCVFVFRAVLFVDVFVVFVVRLCFCFCCL